MTNHQPDPHSLARTSPLVDPIHGRQPFESAEEYARLLQHLAAGPERTYKATAAALGIHPATVAKLGAEARWQVRCEAWDREEAEHLSKSVMARRIYAQVGQADLGRKMRLMAEAGLDGLADEGKVITDTKDLVALATAGAKIESAALGVAERQELEITIKDPNTMSRDETKAELEDLQAQLAKMVRELDGTAGAEDAS